MSSLTTNLAHVSGVIVSVRKFQVLILMPNLIISEIN